LARFGRFRGRTLFSGMIYAPLVMPEVITGLSLLLMFVALAFGRGFLTVTLAHITFSMCFVAVVVQSRLSSVDRSIEEAAMDLGCPPMRTFFYITLPIIAPAVISGWLLSFTLSLDDLVIASFTTGPGATTLPMKIYSQVRLGITPEINAVSTILVGIVATGVLITSLIARRQETRRREEELAAMATEDLGPRRPRIRPAKPTAARDRNQGPPVATEEEPLPPVIPATDQAAAQPRSSRQSGSGSTAR